MSIDTDTASETDQWVRLDGEDTDASIDRFEVKAARRALALLKNKLGRERLLELLTDEIAAGSAYLREHVAASAGQEAIGTTTLQAHGITGAQFGGWLAHAFGREDALLAGHPEHYSIHAAGGRVTSSRPLASTSARSSCASGTTPRPRVRSFRRPKRARRRVAGRGRYSRTAPSSAPSLTPSSRSRTASPPAWR